MNKKGGKRLTKNIPILGIEIDSITTGHLGGAEPGFGDGLLG